MKKLLLVCVLIATAACSSLKSMDVEHKAQRKELREVQKTKKKELGEKHKLESKKLAKRLELERELLKAKQAIELVEYGGEKYKALQETIKALEELLK